MITATEKIMMLDTETTNGLEDPIVYDVGFEVFDLSGRVYETASFINQDVFKDTELMASAYYVEKIPQYEEQIKNGKSVLLPWCMIKWKIYDVCKRHNVKIVSAHNVRFDYKSLHYTQRYITTSKYRYVLPKNVEWWDTLKMAKTVFAGDYDYRVFCLKNNYVTANNQNRYTAEIIYRFLSGDNSFDEAHKGLDDVRIEKEIFRYCVARNPEIDGRLYTKQYEPKNNWHRYWWKTGV